MTLDYMTMVWFQALLTVLPHCSSTPFISDD